METAAPHRVVIIGGGFGGLFAAKSLRSAPVRVTLVDRRNFHLFQPLLYQVATGTLSVGNIAAPLRVILKKQRSAQVLMGEMTALDPDRRTVILQDAEIPYDTLVIAAGSEPHYFGNNQWRAWAPTLKSLEDATAMRGKILRAFESAERETDPEKAAAWMTFVIVGAGSTGVELAGALAEVAHKTLRNDFRKIHPEKTQILLINGRNRVLPDYPADLSRKAEACLRKLGVVIRDNIRVTDVRPDAVILGEGPKRERIPTRTILWAAGVRASSLGQAVAKVTGAALDDDGRIKVQPDLSIPGHPDIFVIGDLARVNQDGKVLPGVAQVAIQEGRYVAQLIEARLRGVDHSPFRYHDRGSLSVIGRNAAVADLGRLRFNGFLAWLAWAFVHLANLIEFEDRMLVMVQWAWNYLTWNRSDLLITYQRPLQWPGGHPAEQADRTDEELVASE